MKKKLLLLLSVMLFGCQFGNQKLNTDDLDVINLTKSYPKKEIRLQDIANIEYIPLETTDDVLLGSTSFLFHVCDKYILVRDGAQGIFVFSRNGKIISHFNRRGQGDKEYIQLGAVIFDEKNEELFVKDESMKYRFLVYSISGEYKRTVKYSDDLLITGNNVCNFDDETLLVYEEYRWFSDDNSEKPYLLLSKQDGSVVTTLNINLPVRYSYRQTQVIDPGGGRENIYTSLSFPVSNSWYYGEDFVITDISSDTIYRLSKDRNLTPMLVHTPSVHSSEPRKVWSTLLTTDKFIVLWKFTLDFRALEQQGPTVPEFALLHEFETGETSEVTFVNDDYTTRKWTPAGRLAPASAKNMDIQLIQVPRLKAALEEKQLKGDLEKLVATLDEDDNPVVMIVKFK